MKYLSTAIPFIVIIAICQICVQSGMISPSVLPSPSSIAREIFKLAFEKNVLFHHIIKSMERLVIGYILALVAGLTTGLILSANRTVRDMFTPLLNLLMSVPTIAWVPVLLIVLGLGDATVITTIFLGGFFEIVVSTIVGVRTIPRQQIYAARIMGVGRIRMLYKILIPASLVTVLPALRLCLGYCWRALVGGEMLSAMIQWGLGKMIYEARFWNDIKVMFVGLIVIGILGVILDRLMLQRLERKTIVRWGMISLK